MESKNHKLREVQKSIWELVDSEILTWIEAEEIALLLQAKKIDILA